MTDDVMIYVVDDDNAMLSSLQFLIESIGLPVSIFNSANDFLAAFDDTKCGCLLLDVRMPGMSGLELQEALNKQHIDIPIIFITGHGDVPMAVRAMKAGAIEFLNKPFNDQELLDSIHRAIELDKTQRVTRCKRNAVMKRLNLLTNREREVLERLMTGKLNKVIASDMNLSIKTIELHRSNIMKKMETRSLAQLISLLYAHQLDAKSATIK